MPWNIKSSNQMRSEFIKLVSQPEISMAEACRSFNISRKTGYKWLRRYEKDGDSGLMDQSRRPVNQPTKLSEKVLLRIVSVRVAHKHWGADKIRAILKREHISPLPGRTTIHRVLRQAGLINLRRKRIPRLDNLRLVQDGGADLQVNDEWTIDFKGWWKSKDGERKCYPLTIRDAKSRFILGVTLLPDSKEESVRQAMIKVFERYGLPKSIRSDNGSPFACTQALLGLSKLSAWWIRLGIEPNRGRVGCPQDNGAHERMHKDMKSELQAERADTQTEMDEWVHEFNTIRPHQALNGDTPTQHYRKSPRVYTNSLVDYDYGNMPTRKIDKHGDLKWHSMDYFLSEALRGERIGLKSIGKRRYEAWFCEHLLGIIDEEAETFTPQLAKGCRQRIIQARRKQKAYIKEF